jgi:hypothetical protein
VVAGSVWAAEPIADHGAGSADAGREPRIAAEQFERLHQRSAVLIGLLRTTGGLVEGQPDRSSRQVISLGAPDNLALDAAPQGGEEGRNPRLRLDLGPMPHHLGRQTKRPEVVHIKSGQIEDDGVHWRGARRVPESADLTSALGGACVTSLLLRNQPTAALNARRGSSSFSNVAMRAGSTRSVVTAAARPSRRACRAIACRRRT